MSTEKPKEVVVLSKGDAIGMALRVEDAAKMMKSLLDGAQEATHPGDMKRLTMIIMARDVSRHLDWVAKMLRGES